jgi:hypothetical protein
MHSFLLLLLVNFALWPAPSNPFVGKWKIDVAHSHITGATDSVSPAGPNTWIFAYGSSSWTIKADNSDQPTPFGTTALKIVSPANWQFTNKSNGRLTGHENWILSPDGNSMTRTSTVPQEYGKSATATATMKRVAGSQGFEGTWESTEVKMPFDEVDIAPDGEDGISLNLPSDGTHYSLKFDGKDYPEQGPRLPDGVTVSALMTGARRISATTKFNGKVFDNEEWEVSADGSTFTYTQRDVGDPNPAVIILHRINR